MTDGDLRRNTILGQLPEREFEKLQPNLHIEDVGIGHEAYEPGTPIRDVYFPLSAVFSLVALADGRMKLEVATIGHEGMVGLPVFLGATSSPQAAFCQIPGRAARMSVDHFREGLSSDGSLHALLNRYTQVTMVQVAQNVVCNSSHSTEARMARWLLTSRDRVASDEFTLTQKFLGQMLGVRRTTVSDTARSIQSQGMIKYSRGVITIIDGPELEKTACECYWIIREEFGNVRNVRRSGPETP